MARVDSVQNVICIITHGDVGLRAWVARSSPSVCLFIRNITQKRMIIPKCSMTLGNDLRISYSVMILELKGQIISNQISRFAKAPHHQSSGAPNIMTLNRDKNKHTK